MCSGLKQRKNIGYPYKGGHIYDSHQIEINFIFFVFAPLALSQIVKIAQIFEKQ